MGKQVERDKRLFEEGYKAGKAANISESIDTSGYANFELGKYYEHNSGEKMHIIGAVKTTAYSWCFVAEVCNGHIRPVGIGEGYSENWKEITEKSWLTGFSA